MNITNGDNIYFLQDLLGTGMFSNVHLTKLKDKEYAIKITKIENKKVYKHELKIYTKLNHDNVVKLYDFFEDKNNCYLLLEYCNTSTLSNLRKKRKDDPFSIHEIKDLMLQIIDGVRYIHSCLIVHRDLKMPNIYINNFTQIKIGDFGLSEQLKTVDSLTTQTSGTPNYISPEVLYCHPHSFSVDIWAIGVILYALYFKKLPFDAKDSLARNCNVVAIKYKLPDDTYETFKEIIRGIFIRDTRSRLSLDQISSLLLS